MKAAVEIVAFPPIRDEAANGWGTENLWRPENGLIAGVACSARGDAQDDRAFGHHGEQDIEVDFRSGEQSASCGGGGISLADCFDLGFDLGQGCFKSSAAVRI